MRIIILFSEFQRNSSNVGLVDIGNPWFEDKLESLGLLSSLSLSRLLWSLAYNGESIVCSKMSQANLTHRGEKLTYRGDIATRGKLHVAPIHFTRISYGLHLRGAAHERYRQSKKSDMPLWSAICPRLTQQWNVSSQQNCQLYLGLTNSRKIIHAKIVNNKYTLCTEHFFDDCLI